MRFTKYKSTNVVIPDNDLIGITDVIEIKSQHFPKSVSLALDIDHDYLDDLIIELTNPAGYKRVVLQPRHGLTTLNNTIIEITDNAEMTRGGTRGKWKINIIDRGVKDEGRLKKWALIFGGIEAEREIDIEDNSILQMEKYCESTSAVGSLDLRFSISHDHIGDLNIELVSPTGVKKNLHKRQGKDESELKMHWNATMLSEFVDLPSNGTWILAIEDKLKGDSGRLNDWNLAITTKD